MTERHDAIIEAMQFLRDEAGTRYSDFGRWAVGDPRFYERVKLGRRLRRGEGARALALAVRLIQAQIVRWEGQERRA